MGTKPTLRQNIDVQTRAASVKNMLLALGGFKLKPEDSQEAQIVETIQILQEQINKLAAIDGTPEISDIKNALKKEVLLKLANLNKPNKQGNLSMLDITTLGVKTPKQAKRKLKNFGADIDTSEGLTIAIDALTEAVRIYEKHIQKDRRAQLPEYLASFRTQEDIIGVVLTASGQQKGPHPHPTDIKKACTLLRLALASNHLKATIDQETIQAAKEKLEKLLNTYFRDLRDLDGNNAKIFTPHNSPTAFVVGGIKIRKKPNDSILLKILHEPETDPRGIKDLVGATIYTLSKEDTLRIVYDLFFNPESAILGEIHIHPSEMKNLLISKEKIREILNGDEEEMAKIAERLQKGEPSGILEEEQLNTEGVTDNPNSGKDYTDLIHIVFDLPVEINGKVILVTVELQVKDYRREKIIKENASHADYKEGQTAEVVERIGSNNLHSNNTKKRR